MNSIKHKSSLQPKSTASAWPLPLSEDMPRCHSRHPSPCPLQPALIKSTQIRWDDATRMHVLSQTARVPYPLAHGSVGTSTSSLSCTRTDLPLSRLQARLSPSSSRGGPSTPPPLSLKMPNSFLAIPPAPSCYQYPPCLCLPLTPVSRATRKVIPSLGFTTSTTGFPLPDLLFSHTAPSATRARLAQLTFFTSFSCNN